MLNNYGIGDVLCKVCYESFKVLLGKVGVVVDMYFYGICIYEEICVVMYMLWVNGIDVYVSIVLFDDVVCVFVGNLNYGYGVLLENVIGLWLDM